MLEKARGRRAGRRLGHGCVPSGPPRAASKRESVRVRCLVGCLDGRVWERGVLRVRCLDGCLDGVVLRRKAKRCPARWGRKHRPGAGLRRAGRARQAPKMARERSPAAPAHGSFRPHLGSTCPSRMAMGSLAPI